jgi:hypothetical protein
MKKRHVIAATLMTIFIIIGTSAISVAIDVVPYMGLKAGKWAITQEKDSISQQGYVMVKGTNGQIVKEWYSNEGSGWTFDEAEVFQITPSALLYIGVNDGKDLWIFDPTVSIPRPLSLNQAVSYSGVLRNQRTNAVRRITQIFMVTKSGLTVDTTAGSFSGCIKARSFNYIIGTSRDAATLLCSGRDEVQGWVSKIKDTTDPQVETQNEFSFEMIQFGDSNSPIP